MSKAEVPIADSECVFESDLGRQSGLGGGEKKKGKRRNKQKESRSKKKKKKKKMVNEHGDCQT